LKAKNIFSISKKNYQRNERELEIGLNREVQRFSNFEIQDKPSIFFP